MLTCHPFCRSKVVHHESCFCLFLPFTSLQHIKSQPLSVLGSPALSQTASQMLSRVITSANPDHLLHPEIICSCKTYHPLAALPLYGPFAQLADGFVPLRRLWTARRYSNFDKMAYWFIYFHT